MPLTNLKSVTPHCDIVTIILQTSSVLILLFNFFCSKYMHADKKWTSK